MKSPENNQQDSGLPLSTSDLLADFDALPHLEQRAWLAFFGGAQGIATKYGDEWKPRFGKYECEQVDFETVWLGKYVELGWLQITEERRFKALGMPGQPDSVEYNLRATEKGWNVREAWWARRKFRSANAERRRPDGEGGLKQ
jgi:hypothetical protein